ncbi:hypothetical protein OIU84_027807 [Salix udensis]|uniref:Uncharacterized protein n=1 Tax=Salix udensis TaxID=889485 RepID=A0AAD6KGP4_9ROSI|nr:hypothetical protein OIU84_027807 [Salix udensis]
MASAVFDQLGYALVGMVLAFVALLLATAELIHMARKERMRLLPISLRPSTRTFVPEKPAGTIVEYFGFVGAVWQCVYSTVARQFITVVSAHWETKEPAVNVADRNDTIHDSMASPSPCTRYEDVNHSASKAPHPKMARPWLHHLYPLHVAMVAAGDDAEAELYPSICFLPVHST